jgi:hypothetical protein
MDMKYARRKGTQKTDYCEVKTMESLKYLRSTVVITGSIKECTKIIIIKAGKFTSYGCMLQLDYQAVDDPEGCTVWQFTEANDISLFRLQAAPLWLRINECLLYSGSGKWLRKNMYK